MSTDCYWCVTECAFLICHCGITVADHTFGDGHSPVGMMCDCECHRRSPFTVWLTRDEREVPLATMSDRHLENLFGHLERRLLNERRKEYLKEVDAVWSRAVSAEIDRRRETR